ncbi:nickel pincer cofactor biosynthesis protein LarC [Actinocrispum wychmicini]|uniref:Pyridinium-3,5-bisthiocarboxylic acid mononucleotide nickel insertion protein n=1 Tax=Actinocrispum wychmicini TaxID=1213861 RepID=A0A4V6NNZ6_9PSEU|nr:nickel pincer cofactor biosynthesis protein LarC [Actinocrispum wychmicini]TCO61120.1 hypothetical protein EV192_103704 [Actinocrispum wychmicini]
MALLWLDVSAGVAGDMMLAALLDLGVELEPVQAAVDAVLPGAVRLGTEEVGRAGLRARRLRVETLEASAPRRTWADLRRALATAALPEPARDRALRAFERLARAEAVVHGCPVEKVHFHEVGAADSVADVVGVCAALDTLTVERVVAGRLALGSGRLHGEHGDLPVPAPAVLELVRGRPVFAGGEGELATPTGAALLAALTEPGELPDMVIDRVGIGAGTRDVPGRANVVRAVLGTTSASSVSVEDELVIECNVDDLDPRVWPTVLDDLLTAGAKDAWLVPILMKKGRPGHTLTVLCAASAAGALRQRIFALTTTIGVRETRATKRALPRAVITVTVAEVEVRLKVAHDGGRVLNAMPEFDDVVSLAQSRRLPVATVLGEAHAAAAAAGIVTGATWPPSPVP